MSTLAVMILTINVDNSVVSILKGGMKTIYVASTAIVIAVVLRELIFSQNQINRHRKAR
jgi:hypothetical protein